MPHRYDVPDHPVIFNLENTGYPDGKEPKHPCCPECYAEAEVFYRVAGAGIVGCDSCLIKEDARESGN